MLKVYLVNTVFIKNNQMKSHLVNILFKTEYGNFKFNGLIKERLNDNGKFIIYPNSLFKKLFGFELPKYSQILLM